MKHKIFIVIVLLLSFYGMSYAEMDMMDHKVIFVSADLSRNPWAFGAEIGVEAYFNDIFSLNGSLMLIAHQHSDRTLTGFRLGTRAAMPYRISPFVGLGAFYGYSEISKDADDDDIDNDNDGFTDEEGEQVIVVSDDMAIFYPEIGIHIWVTKSARFTAHYAYNFSSFGRRSDFKVIGLSFGVFFE